MAEVVDAQAARARPKMTFMADMVGRWREQVGGELADFGAAVSNSR